MKLEVSFLEGKKQVAKFDGHEVFSDATLENGGSGNHPEPFDYFAASLGLCTAHYAHEFFSARGLSTEGFKLDTDVFKNEEGQHVFKTKVTLPSDFPAKYHKALLATMSKCTVKKSIKAGPVFEYLI